jgi:hypothetical protein
MDALYLVLPAFIVGSWFAILNWLGLFPVSRMLLQISAMLGLLALSTADGFLAVLLVFLANAAGIVLTHKLMQELVIRQVKLTGGQMTVIASK